MADVMWSAVTADSQPTDVTEYIAQLQLENATLRELLSAGRNSLVSPVCSQGAQTEVTLAEDDEVDDSVLSCDKTDMESEVDSTVIEVSQHEPTRDVTSLPPQTAESLTHLSPAATSSDSDVIIDDIMQRETLTLW